MSLENRTAVISGATGGLGSILTRDLAAKQANLVLLGRDTAKLQAFINQLGLSEDRTLACEADLVDLAQAKAAAKAAVACFGRVDILIHLVGGWTGGKPIADTPAADLDLMLDQHVRSSFNTAQAFVPHLVRNGWGRILMVSSPSAQQPKARGGPYAIAKAGQEALVLTLAQELKGSGVTANLLQVKMIDVKGEKVSAPTPENASWVTPAELSAAVMFLLSEESGTVNGVRLPVYGG